MTDPFGPELSGMRDLLGFVAATACPNDDGEGRRRDVSRELVASGIPPGYAADDAAALHFVDGELHEVVAWSSGARAYRVEPGAEKPLDVRVL